MARTKIQKAIAVHGIPSKAINKRLRAFEKSPPPKSCRLIDFDRAEVLEEAIGVTVTAPPILVVRGSKPIEMEISLNPLVYIRQPAYWGIEVVGCIKSPSVLPAFEPFSVQISLADVIGTKGIEVVGATKSLKIAVTRCCCKDEE